MTNPWRREIGAVFAKELAVELRSKAGLMTAGLFGLSAVVAIAMASFNQNVSPTLAAGLIWVVLIFASAVALPRAFLVEEEQATADLLRMIARPHAVFWGKALFNLAQMLVIGLVTSGLYLLFSARPTPQPGLFVLTIALGCAALAGTVTLCGALVAQAANRASLAGAVSVPLLIPLAALGVAALRTALGDPGAGEQAAAGLAGYAAVTLAVGPHLYAAVWKG
ncbi:MAG: heme exporter protein CcmB [Fimbriimonas ginsengisoli]|uniref:Heme exporter protein CcmB n=1 Tax=Fimbriimonas ginsengisoli TaxID=1005039 RepID=A0A931PUZ0_FIMGI|nr:heme exporter protein CcmB [Fimbriimonas ginsengisoli]